MPCQSKGQTVVPSCNGPLLMLSESNRKAEVFCPTCKRIRKDHFEGQQRQIRRNADRDAFVKDLSQKEGLTGTSLQKQVTARTEQVIVELFDECAKGRRPADFALMACGSMARREMVAYSDIDAVLVLSNNDSRTMDYFRAVVETMNTRLLIAGGGDSGFRFCPGGLSPMEFCDTIDPLIERATDPNNGDHVRGALFTRMIYGNEIWGKTYSKACEKALGLGGRHQKLALQNLRQNLERRNTDWKLPAKGALYVDIKSQLYRPVHMIVNEIALYYGVSGGGTREQILDLQQKGKVSLQMVNILMQVLEDYAKVGTAHQISRGREEHYVRLRDVRQSDGREAEVFKEIPLAPAFQIKAIEEMTKRVALLWTMTEYFVQEKSKRSFSKKHNPFASKTPMADYG